MNDKGFSMIPRHFSISTAQSFFHCQQRIKPEELSPLSAHCPGLAQFDWSNYLYCSMWRVEKVLDALYSIFSGYTAAHILDFGSWLGNFSLAAAYAGYHTTAAECWARYSPALHTQQEMLRSADVGIIDIDSGSGTGICGQGDWDVILLMSVIEHIPHTPRRMLKQLFDCIRPGGHLILDTPNLAYIANRRRLNRGLSPYVPIAEQFLTQIPFEGHNREYTAVELEWMLKQTGFQIVRTDFYNYSMYGVSFPHLLNARSLLPMLLDPTKRELIFIVARKPQ